MRLKASVVLAIVVQFAIAQNKPTRMDHSAWDLLLRKYVSSTGRVDYTTIKNDLAFDRYLAALSRFAPQEAWSQDDKKAYWINAYNAFTVKLICDHLPLMSIRDIGEAGTVKFIKIGGTMYGRDGIEKELMRIGSDDPRIHFAVADATTSGPVLSSRAYTASGLNLQLDDAAKRFINDPSRNKLGSTELQLSKVFQRFKEDFTVGGTLQQFLQRYAEAAVLPEVPIRYLDYDLSLNGE